MNPSIRTPVTFMVFNFAFPMRLLWRVMGKPERKHFKKWTSPYILKGQALFQKSKTTVDLQTKRAERDQR